MQTGIPQLGFIGIWPKKLLQVFGCILANVDVLVFTEHCALYVADILGYEECAMVANQGTFPIEISYCL